MVNTSGTYEHKIALYRCGKRESMPPLGLVGNADKVEPEARPCYVRSSWLQHTRAMCAKYDHQDHSSTILKSIWSPLSVFLKTM
jgi:hypothetical protein